MKTYLALAQGVWADTAHRTVYARTSRMTPIRRWVTERKLRALEEPDRLVGTQHLRRPDGTFDNLPYNVERS